MLIQISKRYSQGFYPMSSKFYEDIGYHSRNKVFNFLGNGLTFKNIVAL